VNERIVIEVPKGETAQAVALLIRDALSDFRRAREPPDYYVRTRYPDRAPGWWKVKTETVRARLDLSRHLVVATAWLGWSIPFAPRCRTTRLPGNRAMSCAPCCRGEPCGADYNCGCGR
jgi:hypothetical protein